MRKIYLSFKGPKGSSFGQELAIEVKVMLNQSQMTISQEEFFRRAIQMAETLGLGDFDQCVEALKKTNGDIEQAKKLIVGLSVIQNTSV